MLLCDIGNSFAHFYDGNRVWKESLDIFIDRYLTKKVYFINVNQNLKKRLKEIENWVDLEDFISFETPYKGMGIDRKVLCLIVEDGVLVDAGSAITVDLMEKGKHKGGFILPGIKSYEKCYKEISPVLNKEIDFAVDIENLPLNTKDALNYGVVKPIILSIKNIAKDKKIFLTGGDGKKFLPFLKSARYDEKLIFKGMKKIIKERLC